MQPANPVNRARRIAIKTLGLFGGLLVAGGTRAHHTETHFEDKSAHNVRILGEHIVLGRRAVTQIR
jgi:hypothetical protein